MSVTENILAERDGSIACKATDQLAELDVDTMIFAIGDVADPAIGLPYNRDAYVTNPDQTDPKRAAYELLIRTLTKSWKACMRWAGRAKPVMAW